MKKCKKKRKEVSRILKQSKLTRAATEHNEYARRGDIWEGCMRGEFLDIVCLLEEIEEELGTPRLEEYVKKNIRRAILLTKALRNHSEELRHFREMQLFFGLLDLCPQLEQPVRAYLKQRKVS